MNTLKAKNLAIENYFTKLSNRETFSRDSGCHGVVGHDTIRGLLSEMIDEFRLHLDDKGPKPVERVKPEPRGRYVNRPDWN